MRELGYVVGKNLVIEWRVGEGTERLSDYAAELTRLKVDVLVVAGTPATRAAQAATSIIPIVMAGTNDPVGSGFVKSLARPGGNITGLSLMADELSSKQMELLINTVPKLSNVAVLLAPSNLAHNAILKNIQSAAEKTKISVLRVAARTPQEIDDGFAKMAKMRVEAIIIAPDGLFMGQQREIAELASKYGLPSIFSNNVYAEVGGLMSYGPNRFNSYRRAAHFVDKIFKGAAPADLPVEQPTTFELVINMKTANALHIKIPQSMLIRADRVIE